MLFSGKIISLQKSEQFTGQQSWVLSLLAMHIPTYGMMNRFHLIMRTGLRQSQAQNKTKEILIGLESKLPSTHSPSSSFSCPLAGRWRTGESHCPACGGHGAEGGCMKMQMFIIKAVEFKMICSWKCGISSTVIQHINVFV